MLGCFERGDLFGLSSDERVEVAEKRSCKEAKVWIGKLGIIMLPIFAFLLLGVSIMRCSVQGSQILLLPSDS